MDNSIPNPGSGTPLMDFQLTTGSIKDKSSRAWGEAIAKGIETTINGGYSGYYFSRNARFRQDRLSANGRIDMVKFKDFLDFNGKTNYANLNWQSIRIVNRILSGLIGRWMNRNEKIQVKATDTLSVRAKKEEYDNIEFIVHNRELLKQLEEEGGVQMIPKGVELPSDAEELNLWAKTIQRLPEEIINEMAVNDVLASNGYFDVNKEKTLWDSGSVGLVGTYTWMDDDGVIHIERVSPENALYSYSEHNDFRDTTWRGRVVSLKISELRKRYGKEFHPNDPLALTEEDLYNIALTSKNYQLLDKITWNVNYNVAYMRPYDEYNVDAIEFEYKTIDSEAYTIVTTKKNKSTLIKKGVPNKKADNEVVKEDSRINIYRGVYLRYQARLLEWGLKKNMIRPQDPKEIGNAEFSYSFYMYQNYEMRNVAIPEKIEEPADQMILARLKMQQLVAKMRPTGAAYNVDAMQEIDLGLASGVSTPAELQRIYDQTGNLYHRGRDAEGNPLAVPIVELQNSGFLGQMQGLIELYRFHYQVLKDELGEDPALMQQALQPRVTEGNVNTAQEVAQNATDYMYDAYKYVMEDTAKKVACLLKDSVEYGSNAYRSILKEEDVKGRIFQTEFKLLPDAQQIARFEALVNNAINTNQDLIKFVDPMQLMRIAQEDVKLAEVIFRRGQKKMLLYEEQMNRQNSEMNAKAQQESLMMKAKADAKAKQDEISMKGQVDTSLAKEKQKEIILQGIFGIYAKGLSIPSELKGLEMEMIQNVAIPLFAQNQAQIQQLQEEAESEQEQQMEQEQGAEMPMEEQEESVMA